MPPLLVLVLGAASSVPAPPTIDDVLALDRVSQPSLSPDGGRIAFVVARAAPEGDRLLSAIWLVSANGGEPRRLTHAKERVSGPRFSPDGRRIAFVSDRSGRDQAFVLDLDGGEAVPVTSLPTGVNDVLWMPDGRATAATW